MSITQAQLAKHLGVSQGTVSYAFTPNSKINPSTRKRVLEAAAELGYRPHSAARAMASRQTRNIGVVIHSLGTDDVAGHHAYDTVSGINSVLEPASYTTCLVQMVDVEHGEDGLARVFREQALDGMIVHAALRRHVRERISGLVDRVIWCDSGVTEPVNCIWREEQLAGRLVGQAVIDAGYRDVLFLHGDPGAQRPYHHREQREAGLREVIESASGTVQTGVIGESPMRDVERWFSRIRPGKAVVVSDYVQAEAVMLIAPMMGMIPGRHFALASCDDRGWYCRRLGHLSRATFDRFALGRQAAAMLLERLEAPDQTAPSTAVVPVWHDGRVKHSTLKPTLSQRSDLTLPDCPANPVS